MRRNRSDDFSSSDPDVVAEVDRLIWEMSRNTRLDEIDLRLNCAPKRVQEAMARRPKDGASAHPDVVESWQLSATLPERQGEKPHAMTGRVRPADRPTVVTKTIDANAPTAAHEKPADNPMASSADHKERRMKTVVIPTASRKRSLQQAAQENAMARRLGERIGARISTVEPAPTAETDIVVLTPEQIAAHKKTIKKVVDAAIKAFPMTQEEFDATERDHRTEAYRKAILLMLTFKGVPQALMSEPLHRNRMSVSALLRYARSDMLDPRTATAYFLECLCTSFGVTTKEIRRKVAW